MTRDFLRPILPLALTAVLAAAGCSNPTPSGSNDLNPESGDSLRDGAAQEPDRSSGTDDRAGDGSAPDDGPDSGGGLPDSTTGGGASLDTPFFTRPYLNGWILLQDSDVEKALELGPKYGINYVQLSHSIVDDIDQVFESPARTEVLRGMVERLKAAGMIVHVWAREFNVKSFNVCFFPEKPEEDTIAQRQEAYRKALKLIPGIDGVVLMFGSASLEPFFAPCTCAGCKRRGGGPVDTPPVEERVRMILKAIYQTVSVELGKDLIMRDFNHAPGQQKALLAGINGLAEPFGVMAKDVPQDWQPYYPDNDFFGGVGPRRQIAELDLTGEYWGQTHIPFAMVEYLHRRVRRQQSKGSAGAAGRVSRGASLFGTPNEVNALAMTKYVTDASAGPDEVWREFIPQFYGPQPDTPAFDRLRRVLMSTFDVGRKMYYPKGFWALEKSSEIPSKVSPPAELAQRNTALWDPDWSAWFQELSNPTENTLADLWQEKTEALELAQANSLAMQELAPSLREAGGQDLARRIRRQEYAVRIWRHVTDAVFRHLHYNQNNRPERHANILMWDAVELEKLAGEVEREFGDVPIGRPSRVREFAKSVRDAIPASATPEGVSIPSIRGLEAAAEGGDVEIRFSITPLPAGAVEPAWSAAVEVAEKLPLFRPAAAADKPPADGRWRIRLGGKFPPGEFHYRVIITRDDGVRVSTGDWRYVPPRRR
ncbi:MAG: hypothetical protein GMKNLPBB_00394 [Myxococcota bacterium]|nr:hypothetical protein [Myxococcota bacterium]